MPSGHNSLMLKLGAWFEAKAEGFYAIAALVLVLAIISVCVAITHPGVL